MNETNPHLVAERMMTLSEEQSRLSDESTTLEIAEVLYFHSHRAFHKSDKATTTAWRVMDQGMRQITVENRLRAIKDELSVIKNYLRHAENRARNIY